jgi:hypothetical protein
MDSGIYIRITWGDQGMPEKKRREKVVAEITVAHLTQFAAEAGRALSNEEALSFLNQHGRAYEMWKHMMLAGEEYIKAALQSRSPVVMPRQAGVRDRLAV